MKRIQPAGKSEFCSPTAKIHGAKMSDQTEGKAEASLENLEPTLEDSGFFGTPGAANQWDWNKDRRGSGSKEVHKEVHLWETPVKYIRNKWKGRASFVEEESSQWTRKLGPQHILKGLIVLVILASLGFAVLAYNKHISGAGLGAVNNKYKSIEFGRMKRSAQLEEEGKLIKDIVDDEGNELGGKKAAIQFAHDLKDAAQDGLNQIKDDTDPLLELEAQLNEIRDLFEQSQDFMESELIKNEGFGYVAENEELINLKTRDTTDNGFRFAPDTSDDGFRFAPDSNSDDAFRFVAEEDSKLLNKRNTNDDGFRLVADNTPKEDTFRLTSDNEDGFRFASDQ